MAYIDNVEYARAFAQSKKEAKMKAADAAMKMLVAQHEVNYILSQFKLSNIDVSLFL